MILENDKLVKLSEKLTKAKEQVRKLEQQKAEIEKRERERQERERDRWYRGLSKGLDTVLIQLFGAQYREIVTQEKIIALVRERAEELAGEAAGPDTETYQQSVENVMQIDERTDMKSEERGYGD